MSRIIKYLDGEFLKLGLDLVEVQCFPLFSLLLASNLTTIDYFSLDVEGEELNVLKNIPWHNVDIKVRKEAAK